MKYLNQKKIIQVKKINPNFESYDDTKFHNSLYIPKKQKTMPNYGKRTTKVIDNLADAILAVGLKDGMTISFHHHYRHGDETIALVLDQIQKLNIKNLTVSASSFTQAHDCIVQYLKDDTISCLIGSAIRGKLGDAVSEGLLQKPAILRSHGGRARAIACGEDQIDVAFLAASTCDCMGNATGMIGPSACGALGYAMVDALYAKKVIILTDNIVNYPNLPASIKQENVDYVVKVNRIGDPKKIAMGEIHTTFSAKELAIAHNIYEVIYNTPWFQNGFSFQTGAGGASLASLQFLKDAMIQKQIQAGFFLGGIVNAEVKMLEANLVQKLIDVQSFDLGAVQSISKNKNHIEVSASEYANMHNKSAFVDKLDYGVLAALEVDTNFNVNVMTGADGYIRGAIGGHQDVAYGANVTIVGIPLIRGRISSIVPKLQTIITPGNTIDVVATEVGIAINPLRSDLIKALKKTHLKIYSLEQMCEMAQKIIGKAKPIEYDEHHITALVEYRDGSIIDVIYKVKPYFL